MADKLINFIKGELQLYKKGDRIIKCLGNYYNNPKWTKQVLYDTNLTVPTTAEWNDTVFEVRDPDMFLSPLYIICMDGSLKYSHIIQLQSSVIYEFYHFILNLLLKCKVYINDEVYNNKVMDYVIKDKATDLELGEYIRNLNLITDSELSYNLNSDYTIWLTNLEGKFAFVVKRIYVTGKDDKRKRILRIVLSNICSGLSCKLRSRNQFKYLTENKKIIINNIVNNLMLAYENPESII